MNKALQTYKANNILYILILGIGTSYAGIRFGFPLVILGVIGLAIAMAIIANIKFGIMMLTCSFFYVRPLFYLPVSHQTYIRLDDIIWILVVLSWVLKKHKPIRLLPLAKPLGLFMILVFFSLFRTASLARRPIEVLNTLWFVFRLIQYISVYFIVGTISFTDKERDRLFSIILISGVVVSIIGILQYLALLPHFPPTRHIAAEGPLTATFTFKAQIGAVMLILILLTIDKLSRTRINIIIGFSMLVLFSILLLLTQSRSAWVATVFGVLIYLFTQKRRIQIFWLMGLIFIGITISSLVDVQQLYQNRAIIDLNTGSLAQDAAIFSRFYAYRESFRLIFSHPGNFLFGVGFMNWRYALSSSTLLYSGHNNYITTWGELGIFGFIAFYNIWFVAVIRGWNEMRRKQPFARFYLSVIIALLVAAFAEDIFWPGVALESFLGFIMLISALSLRTNKRIDVPMSTWEEATRL